MRTGGVKKSRNFADVIYGWPLTVVMLCCRAQDSDAKVASLQSEMGSFEAKIRQIQSELDVQREKNDVSRTQYLDTYTGENCGWVDGSVNIYL